MKEYIKVNNPKEMEKLLFLYEKLNWRANISGLKYQVKSKGIYPVVVGHNDGYAWYLNDHGNDGKKYFTVDKILRIHNMMSHEKVIYIPYNSRPLAQFSTPQLTVHTLQKLHKEGKITSDNVGVRFIEKCRSNYNISVGRLGVSDNYSWKKFDCELKSFKVVNSPTITSYEQVGEPKFFAGKRYENSLTHDFWEVSINLPGNYEQYSNDFVLEKYLEITDFNSTDPMNGCCREIRLDAESRQEPSNYLYYTLFL